MAQRKHCTYIFTIQRASVSIEETGEISKYFALLCSIGCEVIVVDGSPLEVYAAHEGAWYSLCRHVKVDSKYHSPDFQVNSFYTGAVLAGCQKVIAAADNIRYTADDILRMCELLERFELVRPQNYLYPLSWWSKVESVSILVNRTIFPGGDSPETFGFLAPAFRRACNGRERNLENPDDITRQLIARRARVCYALDFLIRKNSPAFKEWCSSCFRNTYRSFNFSLRSFTFILIVPLGIALGIFSSTEHLMFYVAAILLNLFTITFLGRFRGGSRFFPLRLPLFSPVWLIERILCYYKTLFWLLTPGGHPSFASTLRKKSRHYHIKGPVTVKLLEGNRKTEKNL